MDKDVKKDTAEIRRLKGSEKKWREDYEKLKIENKALKEKLEDFDVADYVECKAGLGQMTIDYGKLGDVNKDLEKMVQKRDLKITFFRDKLKNCEEDKVKTLWEYIQKAFQNLFKRKSDG